MNHNNIGEKIRLFRKRAGISQMELEVAIGASSGMISRIETGVVDPSKETLVKLVEILRLRAFETATLFDVNMDESPRMVLIAKELNKSLNLDQVLQDAVNLTSRELNLLGVVIFLKNGEKVYVKSVTQSWYTELVFKIIGRSINKLAFNIAKDTQSIVVKTILEKKIFYGSTVHDISVGLIPKEVANVIQKTTGQKSAITFPLVIDNNAIGAILFTKTYLDDFSNEMHILEAFTELVTSDIINAQKFERLNLEIKNLRHKK